MVLKSMTLPSPTHEALWKTPKRRDANCYETPHWENTREPGAGPGLTELSNMVMTSDQRKRRARFISIPPVIQDSLRSGTAWLQHPRRRKCSLPRLAAGSLPPVTQCSEEGNSFIHSFIRARLSPAGISTQAEKRGPVRSDTGNEHCGSSEDMQRTELDSQSQPPCYHSSRKETRVSRT